MGSKWRKVKMALVSNLCVYVPTAHNDGGGNDDVPHSGGFSDAALLSPVTRPASPSLRLSKSFNRSSKLPNPSCFALFVCSLCNESCFDF
ncbi:zinc finger (C3HC4-type RING finger) family protein [Artemisia annua]|uniref:Zinc finger (C3HC4-type RING finger) family protein n=1 Tax=Artemisia annua TaxID=35608 RepID=A0A2U1MJU1_ARTAN|nr:zinc finger (C3HC4-type RING finger) family protein [Artemisia annua]